MEKKQMLFGFGLGGALLYLIALLLMPALRASLYYEILFGFLVAACLGHYWGREGLKRWVAISLLFGVLWEIVGEANFAYADNLAPMLYFYKDVPLAVCLWWVVNFMLASDFSRRLAKRYGDIKADFLAILLIMLPFEAIGHNILKMWAYTNPTFVSVPPYWLPWQVVLGWLFFGNLFLSAIYRYVPEAFKQK